MQEYLIDLLCCPICHGDLSWTITARKGSQIEEGTSSCVECGAEYPIRQGIAVYLTASDNPEDLWQDVESNLMSAIKENPDLNKALMNSSIESLNPADQFFRAMALEELGDFEGAESAEKIAHKGLYTREFLDCWKAQVEYLIGKLERENGPIIDIASGRCYLVKEMVQGLAAPIVASDFSLQVMKRNRQWLEFHGLTERVSLLVFDARQSPFKTRSIQCMTTNLGLPNMRGATSVYNELRRVVSGRFLGISNFYLEQDANAETIASYGLAELLYEKQLEVGLSEAGFRIDIENRCRGEAKPTPVGEVLKDAQIDGLPVADTDIDWCVIQAS
ncbi:MAG TPA: Trm112 family protein [candidate division Zixibacteria bacterium]|nr:Trm112 family protein [candidate division Zixibacteria bacterium]